MTFLRFIILFCLLHLLNLMYLEEIHKEGITLHHLKNLPHRACGILFYAHMKAQYREDYASDYIQAYLEYADGEMIYEGQPRPIVKMYAVTMARQFPRSKALWYMRDIIMENHETWLRKREEEK